MQLCNQSGQKDMKITQTILCNFSRADTITLFKNKAQDVNNFWFQLDNMVELPYRVHTRILEVVPVKIHRSGRDSEAYYEFDRTVGFGMN